MHQVASQTRRSRRIIEQQPFRLLDLPPEVRNTIYALVLQQERVVVLQPANLRTQPTRMMALTQTSRAYREETLGLFYSINTFELRGYRFPFAEWLTAMGRTAQENIRFVHVMGALTWERAGLHGNYFHQCCARAVEIDLRDCKVELSQAVSSWSLLPCRGNHHPKGLDIEDVKKVVQAIFGGTVRPEITPQNIVPFQSVFNRQQVAYAEKVEAIHHGTVQDIRVYFLSGRLGWQL